VKKTGAWKHSGRVAWRKVADEAVILDVEDASYFSLRGPGLRMWELLGQRKAPAEIVRALAGEYDAPEKAIAEDLDRLVRELRREKLIEKA
jgi:hypothetical protein